MKVENCNVAIVCDVDGCGRLSAYRLTFNKGATYYVCDKCLKEVKNALTKRGKNEEKV